MHVPDFENFLFVPHSVHETKGTLYELSKLPAYSNNAFVLLPYQNPQVKNTEPVFFSITSKREFSPDNSIPFYESEKIRLKPLTSKQNYIKHVTQLKEEIQQGNIYEINYCIRFYSENTGIDPFRIFIKLHGLAKAPYSMLLKTGDEFIICASPELFLKKEGRRIYTKPIKGTTRRGKTKEEDLKLKHELHHNLKERTENVMAVDVARNDLSVFAEKGSVTVNKLYTIETFETVHQMVSTINCNIKENTSFETIIGATFPMASMTGAPKLSAMNLIDRFEDFERNAYSGAMGLIDEQGDYTLPVIIRSIFYNCKKQTLSFAVGGAITYLSQPEQEYEECLLKAQTMLRALNAEIQDNG